MGRSISDLMANKLTQKKIDAFHAAIGRFALTWAEVETYLDLLVLKLRKPPKGVSHQLSAKIKFVRDALKDESAPFAKTALRVIAEIEKLADTRHDYIHGGRIGHSVERHTLSMTLGRLLQPRWQDHRPPVRVTAADVEKVTDRLYEIGGELLDLLETLVTPTKPTG
jgi:hypothetical protein